MAQKLKLIFLNVIKDRMKNTFCLWGRQQPLRVSWLKFEPWSRISPVMEASSLASITFTTKKFFFLSFLQNLHFFTTSSEFTNKKNNLPKMYYPQKVRHKKLTFWGHFIYPCLFRFSIAFILISISVIFLNQYLFQFIYLEINKIPL